MANLGKVVNSFFSATNENTLALASLNFDFSILKYEAPKEFQVIGNNLSHRRRNEAEDGKTHRIAARLGALFNSIVPATPNLINAYGTRASEIAALPQVNPRNNSKYGPFAEFVGIDGTSLWAAATSAKLSAGTHAPLAMYLLACILARRWDSSVAISIWAELVEQRQLEIEASLQDDPQHISQFMAAKHEVSRDDLASWDASARAWLQSADEAKRVEKTKFDLIAKNVSIDIGSGRQTYQNVIEVWQCAMQGMELLTQGTPQELSNGSILLALSAWHLYPDLIILGKTTKKVGFQDPLISTGGTITIGLQYANDVREPGMHWSLTLSHLRYYEQDVKVDARNDMSRISMKELLVIAFGSLMKCWGVSSQNDGDAARLLIEIRLQLLDSFNANIQPRYDPGWLRIIAAASEEYLELNQTDGHLCTDLVAWGRRRAQSLLASQESAPFFGLMDACIVTALTGVDSHEAALLYFRKYAESIGDTTRTFVVRFRKPRKNAIFYEFATALPHVRRSSKHEIDGNLRTEHFHQRWLYLETIQPNFDGGCNCVSCDSSCPCRWHGGELSCGDHCHSLGSMSCQGLTPTELERSAQVLSLGEGCRWLPARNMLLKTVWRRGHRFLINELSDETNAKVSHDFIWLDPPSMLRNLRKECPSLKKDFTSCKCAKPFWGDVSLGVDQIHFEKIHGNEATYCLFVSHVSSSTSKVDVAEFTSTPKLSANITTSSLNKTLAVFKQKSLNKSTLQLYLICYAFASDRPCLQGDQTNRKLLLEEMIWVRAFMDPKDQMSKAQRNALTALDFAQRLYKHLSGAFITLTVTSKSLSAASWLEESFEKIVENPDWWLKKDSVDGELQYLDDNSRRLRASTARCFACIIFFESGIYDVSIADCLPLIAVASGNSIFVASYLMSDPSCDLDGWSLVRRITGNVGKANVSMLITPQQNPRVRPPTNDLRVVPHLPFDGSEEDNFASTSLHLGFTKWRRPYTAASRGAFDEGLFFVESVVSVHDSGRWVCDLDVQRMHTSIHESLLQPTCICAGQGDDVHTTAIDCWEELLDPPDNVGIMRAKNNWPARLAAFALRCEQDLENRTMIIPNGTKICGKCIAASFVQVTGAEEGVLIN